MLDHDQKQKVCIQHVASESLFLRLMRKDGLKLQTRSTELHLHIIFNYMMTRVKFDLSVEAVIFLWALSFSRGDTDVSCVFMKRCILPCSFRPGNDPIVHWIQETSGHLIVHSYYLNQDQLGHQDQRFRNRTSLFKDQISRGNASLQLTEVEVQDQDRYKCYTSTTRGNKETYINLTVDAPVDKVDIQQVENRIICSSEGIYPEPGLTWSTSPPSNMDLQRTTTIHQTEQQLYNINSSLILSDSDTDLVYICTVSTRSNNRTVTVFILTSINISSSETTIQCTTSVMKLTDFSLMWRFNHSQIILKQTGSDGSYTVSEEWRQQVKGVSESGSLTLQDLSSHHEGIYTCELSNAEETLITNTFLKIQEVNVGAIAGGVVGGLVVGGLVVGGLVVGGLVVGGLVGGFFTDKKRKKKKRSSKTYDHVKTNVEMEEGNDKCTDKATD